MASLLRFSLMGLALVLLLGGVGFAAAVGLEQGAARATRCEPVDAGLVAVPLDARPSDAAEAGWEGVARLAVPAGGEGRLVMCVATGDLTVRPSADGVVRVSVTTASSGFWAQRAVEHTVVEVAQGVGAQSSTLWVRQAQEGLRIPFLSLQGARVDVVVELPSGPVWAVEARGAVSDLRLEAGELRELDAQTRVGRIEVNASRAGGDLRLASGAGGIAARFDEMANATLDLRTKAGTVELVLPEGPGYDVATSTDLGTIELAFGDDVTGAPLVPPGAVVAEERELRTADFHDAPVQVSVSARTTVGDVAVRER